MSGAAVMNPRTRALLEAPILPTLLRLATPNVVGLFAMTVVIGYDGYILGKLGADALAGIALVFPLSMLMMQMSGGGIGGAVTAAVARALGAGRGDEAGRLAQQSLFIAGVLAAAFTLVLLGFGRGVYAAMGGRGAALDAALAYSNVLFSGAIVIWATNVLGAVVRGTGNMLLPALLLVLTAADPPGAVPDAGLRLGPDTCAGRARRRGQPAGGQRRRRRDAGRTADAPRRGCRVEPVAWRLHATLVRDILRVGIPASMSPIVSNASIAVATAFVGSFGTAALAGYGVAARLEYILVPIAFGFGTALTAMVATNMGAGNAKRALRVAWLGAAIVAAITGGIGLATAVAPALWMNLFTQDAAVREFGGVVPAHRRCLLRAVRLRAGLVLCLAGGWTDVLAAGRQRGPLVVALGGWACVHVLQTSASGFFVVVAISLGLYGLIIAGAIKLGSWTR